AELMEDQLLLLLESLDEKIVPQQIILVRKYVLCLAQNEGGHFSVEAPLLSFSREKERELTVVMVEMSGVTLEKDGSAVCTKEAFTPLAALYVSLHVLDLLSN
ncbi:GSDA3 protein, partial [Baryphthengus martii]|nr:GSDA3 protein [Baryphthengus martii]